MRDKAVLSVLGACALALVFSARANAQLPITTCSFDGAAAFNPNLTGAPSSGPIAFTFSGELSGCSGPNAALLNGKTVKTDDGVIDSGGNCTFSTYNVPHFVIGTPGDNDTFVTDCTGSIPDPQGIAAAGVATAIPQAINCGDNGSPTAGFLLQFITTIAGNPNILSDCGPTGAGLSSLAFSGFFGSN